MPRQQKVVAARERLSLLSPNEEITLRRVAFGESPVRSMRAQDLVQLRRLRLIDDGKDGPRLTASGRKHFDTLPKAVALADSGPQDLLKAMARVIRKEAPR
jgi:hypothetical protein